MKTLSFGTLSLVSGLAWFLCTPLLGSEPCSPGPATGGGIDRCYDDGFVRVDGSGNAGGYTWYWGYQSSAQIQDGFLVFHKRTTLEDKTIQVLTDKYDLSGITLPQAPYQGSFTGPGPVLPDAPAFRSITNLTTVQLSIARAVEIGWPSVSNGVYQVQWTSEPETNVWFDLGSPVTGNGTTNVVYDTARGQERRFYRVHHLH